MNWKIRIQAISRDEDTYRETVEYIDAEDLYQAFKKRLLEELTVEKEMIVHRGSTSGIEYVYVPLHDKTAEKKD